MNGWNVIKNAEIKLLRKSLLQIFEIKIEYFQNI